VVSSPAYEASVREFIPGQFKVHLLNTGFHWTQYNDPNVLAQVSRGLGEAMVGINVTTLPESDKLAQRGW
jgi:hypothetical protein